MLRERDVALVVSDGAGQWPMLEEITASFVYVRLHGSGELYANSYSDTELKDWSARIRKWLKQIGHNADAHVYFDNDARAHAPLDARRLTDRVRISRKAEAQ